MRRQEVQTGLFKRDRIVIVEIVQPDHTDAPFKQGQGYVVSDEPGSARHQYGSRR